MARLVCMAVPMADQVNAVATGMAVAPGMPITMLRVVAGVVSRFRRAAALHVVAPTVTVLVPVKVSGTDNTSPLQSEVSKAAWYVELLPVDVNDVLEVAAPAMLRALVEDRLKMLSNALSTPRALL